MTYEIYQRLFIISLILAGLMFVLSIVLFFVLKIPAVIGYLTGKTTKHSIENKTRRYTAFTTSDISNDISKNGVTGNISKPFSNVGKTAKMTDSNTTTVLSSDGTTVLAGTANATTVLVNDEQHDVDEITAKLTPKEAAETTILSNNVFEVEVDITFVHTNEIIH